MDIQKIELLKELWYKRNPCHDYDQDGNDRFWGTVLCVFEDFKEELETLPNATIEQQKAGVLHSTEGYWVSNEGTKTNPNFHVWMPGITSSHCDSAYTELDLAVCRCNFLAKNKVKGKYQPL